MIQRIVHRIAPLQPGEGRLVLRCALFFFCVLCGYYVLRPIREEMGLAGGVRNLPWLYLVNLGVMLLAAPLFGAVAGRLARRRLVPGFFRLLILCLAVFAVGTRLLPERFDVDLGRVFYVWLSVINMWAVSLFWAAMADLHGFERSKRLFGPLAVGGSLGALAGSGLTALAVQHVDRIVLFAVAGLLFELAARTGWSLLRDKSQTASETTAAPLRGGTLDGVTAVLRSPYLLGIALYLFLYSLSSTIVYFVQAEIVDAAVVERAAKAALFARIDVWVNALTVVTQLVLAGRLIPRIGVGWTLALMPLATLAGFALLGLAPALVPLVIFQVVRRAGNYALSRPARETLFTVLPVEQKYKAKSFLDTFVYRGGDALGAGLFDMLRTAGLGLAGIAFSAVPVAALWAGTGLILGAAQRRLAVRNGESTT
jgi:AAA family ATP:ADP antiporter